MTMQRMMWIAWPAFLLACLGVVGWMFKTGYRLRS